MEKALKAPFTQSLKSYVAVTKPGIILGNAVNAIGGFFLASKGFFDLSLFMAMILGLSCIIASGCTFNNYIDREVDQKMARTKNRPLAQGTLSEKGALIFATILGLLGILILAFFANPLTAGVALFGFTVYVAFYSFLKYKTVYGTLIGSFAGSAVPVIGYCAFSNRLDGAALILFIMISMWQMPHFFAIALYRLKDYSAASIPVLPLVKGVLETKVSILLYIIGFFISGALLTLFQYTSYIFLIVVGIASFVWFFFGIKGLRSADDTQWARKMFILSLIVVMALCITIPFTAI